MKFPEKLVNSLASGSNEDCMGLLPAVDKMTPSTGNCRRQLAQPLRSSTSPSSLNRISGRRVSQRDRPIIQKCMSKRHIEIQTEASIFNLQTVTLKFGD
jgi:hypothetical protein